MDPDVVRLYSSSPPPLDEVGEEEDEDEFGDFGGYGGVSSSFSFSEFDTPVASVAFGRPYAAETSPPAPLVMSSQGVSQTGRTTVEEETGKLADKPQAASESEPSGYEADATVDWENGELETSEVHVNGASPSHLQGAHSVLPITGQDFEHSDTGQHRGSFNTGERGVCLSNRPRGADEEVSAVVSSSRSTDVECTGDHSTEPKLAGDQSTHTGPAQDNSTDAGLVHTAGPCPQQPGSVNASQGEEPEGADDDDDDDVVAGERLPEMISDRQRRRNNTTVGPVEGVSVAVLSTQLPDVSEEVSRTETVPSDETVSYPQADEASRVEVDDDDFGDFGDVDQSLADFSQSDSAVQEGFADFVTAMSGCSTDDDFGDTDTLKDLKEEEDLAEEEERGEAGGHGEDGKAAPCLALPPSDSFADFSSAPCGGLADGADESWPAFGQQGECESHHQSWAVFDKDQQSSSAISPPSDSLQTDSVSAVLTCRLQHLFQSTFLSDVTPEVTEVSSLQVLLEPQNHDDAPPSQEEPAKLWRHLLDIHAAHGLKVRWVGSHSNRILLDSLGMRNILFTESKKLVIVPIFASGLGMLEPTKDPGKPSSPSPAAMRSLSPDQASPRLCTPVALSSGISEDAPGGVVSQLNLDFFGPMEESSDADSGSEAPLPGVDPELYELTTAKLENSTCSNTQDAFNRLMETVEKTSTLKRKLEREGEISEEASRVISVLPNLSFMKARVLMFPSILTPTANQL